MITEGIFFFILFVCTIIIYVLSSQNLKQLLNNINRTLLYKRFYENHIIYENHKEQIYSAFIINRLSVFYLNNEKIDNEYLEKYKVEYIKKIIAACGPNIISDIEEMKGSLEAILIDLETFFINRILADEEKIFTNTIDNNRGLVSDEDMVKNISNIKNL